MESKKVVIITGAAKGIGKAIALKFVRSGCSLALADIDAEALEELRVQLNAEQCDFLFIPGDLANDHFLQEIIAKTLGRWGRIDVLVNNAAWRTLETMRNISLENWEKTLRICLTAPAFLAKHSASVMEEKNIRGVIINVSSVMSQRAGGNSPAYITCKGGIESLTYELAVLYGPSGIRVVAVNPGNITTDLSNDYTDETGRNISDLLGDHMDDHTPLRRKGKSDEIANVVYWLSTEEASFITGTSILVDGGFFHNFSSYKMKKIQFPKEF